MRLSSLFLRTAAGLAGLLTAAALGTPLAAQASDHAPAHHLGRGDLAHSGELTAAGVPRTDRSVRRGTGDLSGDPREALVGDRPLARLLPEEHGKVFWLEAQDADQTGFLGQELTEAKSTAAARKVGTALYERARSESGHARHAIAVDGGSLTWFHRDNQGPGVTVSVIRVGRRVSVVVLPADVAHQHRLLVAIADRMR